MAGAAAATVSASAATAENETEAIRRPPRADSRPRRGHGLAGRPPGSWLWVIIVSFVCLGNCQCASLLGAAGVFRLALDRLPAGDVCPAEAEWPLFFAGTAAGVPPKQHTSQIRKPGDRGGR